MDLKKTVSKMDHLVAKGDIVNAVETFFSDDAKTADYKDVKTIGKSQMIEKMQGFTGAIVHVNGIEHHGTIVDGNQSASEFTFDFDMADNSHILWHEIIRRTWNDDGKVIAEEYFLANN